MSKILGDRLILKSKKVIIDLKFSHYVLLYDKVVNSLISKSGTIAILGWQLRLTITDFNRKSAAIGQST
jgi:hypothetical protein